MLALVPEPFQILALGLLLSGQITVSGNTRCFDGLDFGGLRQGLTLGALGERLLLALHRLTVGIPLGQKERDHPVFLGREDRAVSGEADLVLRVEEPFVEVTTRHDAGGAILEVHSQGSAVLGEDVLDLQRGEDAFPCFGAGRAFGDALGHQSHGLVGPDLCDDGLGGHVEGADRGRIQRVDVHAADLTVDALLGDSHVGADDRRAAVVILFLIVVLLDTGALVQRPFPVGDDIAHVVHFVDDRLFHQRDRTHRRLQDDVVGVCDLVSQFDELLLLIDLGQQEGILTVIFDEALEILLVEIVEGAFVGRLVLSNLDLGHIVQTIAVKLLGVMLLVEFEVVEVDAAHEVVGLQFTLELEIFALARKLVPQAHLAQMVLGEDARDAVDQIGNIEAGRVPARQDINIFDHVEEGLQKLAFIGECHRVFELGADRLPFFDAKGRRDQDQRHHLLEIGHVDRDGGDWIERVFGWRKSTLRVEIDLNVEKADVQNRRIDALVVSCQRAKHRIDVALEDFDGLAVGRLRLHAAEFLTEFLVIVRHELVAGVAKDRGV